MSQTKGLGANSGSHTLANKEFDLQRHSRKHGKVYRCLKASAVAWLTKIELLEAVKRGMRNTNDDKNVLSTD